MESTEIINTTGFEEIIELLDENDIFSNYSSTPYQILSHINGVSQIILIIICLSSIACDVLLIHAIRKFDRLKTKTNSYISHFAISNLCFYLIVPVIFVLFELLAPQDHGITECANFEFRNGSLCIFFITMIALVLDWFLNTYQPSLMKKFAFLYKWYIYGIYLLQVIRIFAGFGMCFYDYDRVKSYLLYAIYLGGLLLVIVAKIVAKFVSKKEESKFDYALKIASLVFWLWLPSYIYRGLLALSDSKLYLLIIYYVAYVPEFLAHGSPIFVVYYSGKYNRNFQMAYDKIFRRSAALGYGDDNLDPTPSIAIP